MFLVNWILTKLLKSYCFSFYGCELWDLHNVNIDALCKSWRQAVRRLNLPYNCHVAILEVLSECLPLFDVFYKRSLNFINRCLVSDNALQSLISWHVIVVCSRVLGAIFSSAVIIIII